MIAIAVLAIAMHPIPYWRLIIRQRAPAAMQRRIATVAGPQSAMPYVLGSGSPNCRNSYCGVGLRGGTYRFSPDSTQLSLDRSVYALGTAVSATVHLSGAGRSPGLVNGRSVHAVLSGSSVSEDLDVSWDRRKPRDLALIRGITHAGYVIRATIPAP